MVTHTCLACGENFDRPYWYPNKKKYCSNACSHREIKSVRDKFILDLNDKAIVFHSMWEVRFAATCERLGILWRRYDGPDIVTSEGNYRPDFIVANSVIVDVKGFLRPESERKILEACNQGLAVVILTKDALLRFELGDLSAVFIKS